MKLNSEVVEVTKIVGGVNSWVGPGLEEISRAIWWEDMDEGERLESVEVIKREMERLTATVETWLPASISARDGDNLEIVIRVFPGAYARIRARQLGAEELDENSVALKGLLEILHETNE